MGNESHSIHDFDYSLICEYFASLERQGPGSPEVTVRALSFIEGLTTESRIVDLGCGTGGQTRVLAGHAPGSVTGLDLFPDFIRIFNANSQAAGLSERVRGIVGSMDALPFAEEELDLIWSEGAIYNIGFERGIREWRRFLRPGGYLAVSEASWFTESRPDEIDRFWNEAYPGIDTIANKVGQLQQAGYVPVAIFILPENCWTDHFYKPQVPVQEKFLQQHADNPAAAGLVAEQQREARLYDRYKTYYGYAFYIARKL
ncbi:methyltransferase type 11 [Marinobacterium nitratireducens]|uniref:Methyltransferase type 11 n=1 Tax=Marinobacterium nitratireducens TaxID=518897 RepID=A0A918DV11_9GAMM|nr:class I SAM-dependent methyltransferase [Marinobacterium nitratireducens]GGO83578.1 methyltransferase type 11 [Marinobacterium nitratireducens]